MGGTLGRHGAYSGQAHGYPPFSLSNKSFRQAVTNFELACVQNLISSNAKDTLTGFFHTIFLPVDEQLSSSWHVFSTSCFSLHYSIPHLPQKGKSWNKKRVPKTALFFLCSGLLSLVDLAELAAVVSHAGLAHAVRQTEGSALRASNDAGNVQLPHGAATLIATSLGHFSLRNRHG
jgi:hypothetical protein